MTLTPEGRKQNISHHRRPSGHGPTEAWRGAFVGRSIAGVQTAHNRFAVDDPWSARKSRDTAPAVVLEVPD